MFTQIRLAATKTGINMETYLILLMATNATALNKTAIISAQAQAFKCAQSIEWASLPKETKEGVTYYRLVVSTEHLSKNMGVKLSDVDVDKWATVTSKGAAVLKGDDWRAALDKAGYSEVAAKEPAK